MNILNYYNLILYDFHRLSIIHFFFQVGWEYYIIYTHSLRYYFTYTAILVLYYRFIGFRKIYYIYYNIILRNKFYKVMF